MKWHEIREHYPQQWILLEAIKAHSEANKRILEHVPNGTCSTDRDAGSAASCVDRKARRELRIFAQSRVRPRGR